MAGEKQADPLLDALRSHVLDASADAPGWRRRAAESWMAGAAGDPLPSIPHQANPSATSALREFVLRSYSAGRMWRDENPQFAPPSTEELRYGFMTALSQGGRGDG